MLLSIITPSFNRGYCLHKIYQSLSQFDRHDFEWILVDDGSTDDTELIVQPWVEEKRLNFTYVRQANSGKTNAVIRGFEQNPRGTYTLVLDSDDILLPNAMDLIKKYAADLHPAEIGMVFLKQNSLGEIVGTAFRLCSSNYITMYFGPNRCSGDKLFVVETACYKKSLVAAFPGEKLIPEGVIYMHMQKAGSFRCVNEFLYGGDYLADGLSASTLRLAANNIHGFILEKKLLEAQPLTLKDAVINNMKYISYSIAGGKKLGDILTYSRWKILTVFLLLPTILISFPRIIEIKKIIKNRTF